MSSGGARPGAGRPKGAKTKHRHPPKSGFLKPSVNPAVRREWLSVYKMSKGCTDCGCRRDPAVLEFDHLPQFEKAFNIGTSVGTHSMEELVAETLKCEVVCANCHRMRTAARHREIDRG